MILVFKRLSLKYKGQQIFVEVYQATRGGTKSPVSYYFKYQNKWIVPLESRLGYYTLDINTHFKLTYSRNVTELVSHNKKNSIKELIKAEKLIGLYYQVPDALIK